MRIHENMLVAEVDEDVTWRSSPNHTPGNAPRLIVVHYTVEMTLNGVVEWFLQPNSRTSAHAVIDPDGAVVQMVAFDCRAWHAGRSVWQGQDGVNNFSIGIELVNAGMLQRNDDGIWMSALGDSVADSEIGSMPGSNTEKTVGWHRYTEAQIESCIRVSWCLKECYGCNEIVGHEHISPGRKLDPGPLFPWHEVRQAVFQAQSGFPN